MRSHCRRSGLHAHTLAAQWHEDTGNRAFVLLAVAYMTFCALMLHSHGMGPCYWKHISWGYSLILGGLSLGACARIAHIMVTVRPGRLFSYVREDMRRLLSERGWRALPVLIVYPWLMMFYLCLKFIFNRVCPFAWDLPLMKLDFALHGGNPVRWLIPWLSVPWVTWALDWIYWLWFPLNFVFLFWMTFTANLPLRRQFWATFVLCWILLGTVAGIGFLSGGPCFWNQIVGQDNPYEDQMDALRQANEQMPTNSIRGQVAISEHLERDPAFGGASAMPSMHVSMCMLFTLAAWRASRKAGVTMLVMTALIQLACVSLGWHYAVDGYVSVVGTWLTWWAVGRFHALSRAGKSDRACL
jgi:hypothetical protein